MMTVEEYESLPEHGQKHELLRGELISVSPNYLHGLLQSRIVISLGRFVEAHGLGDVVTETAFEIPTDPPTVLMPDIAFVRAAATPAAEQRTLRYAHVVPDLVVEVISPSETTRSIRTKVAAYLDHGVGMVMLVYPESKEVALWPSDGSTRSFEEADVLDVGDVVPAFTLALSHLFR
ncbi:MAG: Uma2 family endonuclease [Chloroflexia bacterium]|nr:Uma2 family endonuclease [Chloroflexia bacterium]